MSSGLIWGVGPVLAKCIIQKFGERTIDLLTDNPDELRKIPGIGPVKLREIKKSWAEHEDIRELSHCVVESVEAMVRSARAFFKNITNVADHLHKVSHWETQSDKVSTRIQKQIFSKSDLPLSYRMQLRDHIRHVDKIADRAEDVADKLRIYVIKRSL